MTVNVYWTRSNPGFKDLQMIGFGPDALLSNSQSARDFTGNLGLGGKALSNYYNKKNPPLSGIKLLGYFLYINAQSLLPSPDSLNVPSSQTV